ncbi:MAG TPA: hypothetical protein V6C89_20685 [Drouetiella sp.]|jgi:hypothetical protein
MKRLQMLATSSPFPPQVDHELNRALEAFVRVVEFELADTGFYKRTGFSALRLNIELLDIAEPKFFFDEDFSYDSLEVDVKIPSSQIDLKDTHRGFQYIKEQSVRVLSAVVVSFGLDSRVLDIRAFHTWQSTNAMQKEVADCENEIDSIKYESNLPDVIPVKWYEPGIGYSAYMGQFGNGKQFWGHVVASFAPPTVVAPTDPIEWTTRKCWYAILHKFDKEGNHLGTDYKFAGTTADGEVAVLASASKYMNNFIEALGPVVFGDIAIRLFHIEIDGHTFGMIDSSSEECGATATMEPADLVFSAPWDGEYDT